MRFTILIGKIIFINLFLQNNFYYVQIIFYVEDGNLINTMFINIYAYFYNEFILVFFITIIFLKLWILNPFYVIRSELIIHNLNDVNDVYKNHSIKKCEKKLTD